MLNHHVEGWQEERASLQGSAQMRQDILKEMAEEGEQHGLQCRCC